jgi:hypothetical protein
MRERYRGSLGEKFSVLASFFIHCRDYSDGENNDDNDDGFDDFDEWI